MFLLLAPTLMVTFLALALTLISLSVFIRIKFLVFVYEYFARRRLEKKKAGKKFFAVGQKVLWGLLFTASAVVSSFVIIAVLPKAVMGAGYGLGAFDYNDLKRAETDMKFDDLVEGYKVAKAAGIESVYDYRMMLERNFSDPTAYYAARKMEFEAVYAARRQELEVERQAKKEADEAKARAEKEAELIRQEADAAKGKGLSVADYRAKIAEEKRVAAIAQAEAAAREARYKIDWKEDVQYKKYNDNSCTPGSTSVCLSNEQYERACKSVSGSYKITKNAEQKAAYVRSEADFSIIMNSIIDSEDVFWAESRDGKSYCYAQIKAHGLYKGSDRRVEITGRVSVFVYVNGRVLVESFGI